MRNTTSLNTSNKNTNHCGKLKYTLRTKEDKILLSQSSQHTKSASKRSFRGGGGGGERERKRERENYKIILNE